MASGREVDDGKAPGAQGKPGLGIDVGEPAITSIPRAMIVQAVGEAVDLVTTGVRVVISVPGAKSLRRMPARVSVLGPSASNPHVVTVPLSSLTSTRSHECGFVYWNSLTVPVTVTSFWSSNMTAEW